MEVPSYAYMHVHLSGCMHVCMYVGMYAVRVTILALHLRWAVVCSRFGVGFGVAIKSPVWDSLLTVNQNDFHQYSPYINPK